MVEKEETITIRVSKPLIDEIRTKLPIWQSVNATLITDIILRKFYEDLKNREA